MSNVLGVLLFVAQIAHYNSFIDGMFELLTLIRCEVRIVFIRFLI